MHKEQLLERFAKAYHTDGFPPLAGKIMGIFYVYDQKYFSFDEIVKIVNASKGAVSKTLKLLLELKRIAFIKSQEHKRKRLFYLDIQGIKHYLSIVLTNYKKQDELIRESLELRTQENMDLNNFIEDSIKFNAEILEFLEKKIEKYFNR